MAKMYASPSSDLLYMMNLMRTDAITEKECSMDVAELAKIFQALKFRIRSSGVSEPSIAEEMAPHSPAGLCITVTCLKSRQQLVLLRDAHDCSCSVVDEDKGSWEVVATSGSRQSLVETASGKYPPLKAEAALAVRRLMEHVGGLAAGKIEPPPPGMTTPKWRERRSDGWHRLSLGAGEDRPLILGDLASRYRSLDTLIDKDDDAACADLPKPGALLKAPSSSVFDADNRSISDSQIAPPKIVYPAESTPPTKPQVLGYLRTAADNLNKAISLCAGSNPRISVERKTPKASDLHPSGARSSPSLDKTGMPPPKSSDLPRTRLVLRKPTVRPIITTIPRDVKPVKTTVAAPAKKTTPSNNTAASKRFAHIKSTIPKAAPRN